MSVPFIQIMIISHVVASVSSCFVFNNRQSSNRMIYLTVEAERGL